MKRQDSYVAYKVHLHPGSLEMTVEMAISGPVAERNKDGKLELELPTWVPGDYDFEPYGRDVFEVKASDSDGNSLIVERKGFNAYNILTSGDKVIYVQYQASCYEPDLGDAMGLVDSDYAVLMGTRYLFCSDYLGACSVEYFIPEGWKLHHPSGAKKVGRVNKWEYPSFEVLLDTPVSFGDFTLMERTIRDTPFYFLFVDKGIGFDAKVTQFIDQLSVACEKIHDVFHLFPFEDYTFVLSLNPQADWGLEHLTSNMSGLGPEVFVDDDLYATGIRVCAHELFHAWNVRRLRPAPLGQLRHQLCCGSFTEGLWVAEGFTRYYEFLISARAKAYTPDQFFSAVAGYYQHLTQQPAYHRVTATDSSYASYMNHMKYPGRVNNSIDYYDKGMLIAFGLDARLRQAKRNAKFHSLDEAFSAFYLKYFGKGDTVPQDYVGYTTKDVIDFFEGVQPGLGTVLSAEVEAPANLTTPDQFKAIGFEVEWEHTNALGLFFMNEISPTIYGVGDTSPAGQTGIAPKDVILTINGFGFSVKGLEWAASQSEPVELEVLRGHRKLNFTIEPTSFTKMKSLKWRGTEAQADDIRAWLHTDDFHPEVGQEFSLDFYDNFHGNEIMV
jgi:predicted metalloprotease with PDZ domain